MKRDRLSVRAIVPIVVVAINLRPAVSAVGPLLSEIRADLGLSSAAAGALTTLPVLCFGVFGLAAPALRRRFDEDGLLLAGMTLLVVGLIVRVGPRPWTLFTGALLAGMAISVGNVVVPAIIKRDQPGAVTLATSIYTTALTVGAAIASGVVVPVEHATGGGWRWPMGLLAVPAAVAVLVWLPRLRRGGDARPEAAGRPVTLWRDRLAWQVTVFMGLQSLLAYVVFGWLPTLCQDRGMSESAAGLVLAVSCFVQAVGSMLVPPVERRLRDQRPLVVLLMALAAIGFAGFAWAPIGTVWVWTAVLGLGQGAAFALALSFIGLRASSAAVAARLSGMAQGVGYLIASTGPLAIGVLRDRSGGWSVPVAILIAIAGIEILPGLAAGRNRVVGRDGGRDAGQHDGRDTGQHDGRDTGQQAGEDPARTRAERVARDG